jgi:ABC-type ATPase with predicted acetyltransferase domain
MTSGERDIIEKLKADVERRDHQWRLIVAEIERRDRLIRRLMVAGIALWLGVFVLGMLR